MSSFTTEDSMKVRSHQMPSCTPQGYKLPHTLKTRLPQLQQFNASLGPFLIDWQNTTTIWNVLLPVASNRYDWNQLVFPGFTFSSSSTGLAIYTHARSHCRTRGCLASSRLLNHRCKLVTWDFRLFRSTLHKGWHTSCYRNSSQEHIAVLFPCFCFVLCCFVCLVVFCVFCILWFLFRLLFVGLCSLSAIG